MTEPTIPEPIPDPAFTADVERIREILEVTRFRPAVAALAIRDGWTLKQTLQHLLAVAANNRPD